MTASANLLSSTFAKGDLVVILEDEGARRTKSSGRVFEIEQVPGGNRKYYLAKALDGGIGLRAPYWSLRYATDAEVAKSKATVRPIMGSVVRVMGQDGLFVVLGDSNKGGVKIVRLGGDGGRYYPHVPLRSVTVVDPATISAG